MILCFSAVAYQFYDLRQKTTPLSEDPDATLDLTEPCEGTSGWKGGDGGGEEAVAVGKKRQAVEV